MYHARKQLSRKRSQRAAAATFSSPSNVRLTNVEYKRRARGFENTERIVSIRIRIRLIWREIFLWKKRIFRQFFKKNWKNKRRRLFPSVLSYLVYFPSSDAFTTRVVFFLDRIIHNLFFSNLVVRKFDK